MGDATLTATGSLEPIRAQLDWTVSTRLKRTRIQRKVGAGAWTTIETYFSTERHFDDYGAPLNTPIEYRLETLNSKNRTTYSNEAAVLITASTSPEPAPPPPEPPPPPPPPPPIGPQVDLVSPGPGDSNQAVGIDVWARFDIQLDPATVSGTTVKLRDAAGTVVAAAISYDSGTNKVTINPTGNLANSETYTATLTGGAGGIKSSAGVAMAADYVWSFTTAGGVVFTVFGYAGIATPPATGGAGGSVIPVTTWAQYRDAIQGVGLANNTPRTVMPQGNNNFDAGGGGGINVDSDNLTIDWINYHGSIRRHDIQFKNNNGIIREARFRPGDDYTNPNDQDALTFNPGAGNTMGRWCIDHSSGLWALDMGVAILNHVEDFTIQFCIIGAGLRQSAKPDNPKGLGRNITVPGNNLANEATEYGRRMTMYRNYLPHNFQRNLKAERAALVESINEVFYNWGNQVGHGNPRSINVYQNYYRKGNDTTTSRVWEDDTSADYPTGPYPNSIYFPFANSIFVNKNRTPFTPNGDHVGTAEERTTPNGTLGANVTIGTMTDALADAIVAAAGPTAVDSVDQALKDDWTNGTGVFYNGKGFPAPNPTWPVPF